MSPQKPHTEALALEVMALGGGPLGRNVGQSDMHGAVTIGLVSLHKKEKTLDTSLYACTKKGHVRTQPGKRPSPRTRLCRHPDLRTVRNKPCDYSIPSQWPELMDKYTLAMRDAT